jgi:predicted nuclease of restriction endonuclease-like RecB superfamily
MLTADLVRARKKSGELFVQHLSQRELPRALELSAALLDVARASVGQSREELMEAWAAVPTAARERRLADGFRKLIEDICEFSAESKVDPPELRSDVFLAASTARHQSTDEARFDRAAVVEKIETARALEPGDLEQALYADLKGEQILQSVAPIRPEQLVERYDHGQVQAVLLRAVKVVADVTCTRPESYRALFRELKFRRLLYRVEVRRDGGYRIEIDGPFSLFESVTKYGLELALILPALESCDSLALVAEIRWGKDRTALKFRHVHRGDDALEEKGATRGGKRGRAPKLREDVGALLEAFEALETPWRGRASKEILDLPGIGVCIPDLVFEHAETKERVHFEALGFWSRDAVWKRVELVEQGIKTPVLFAVSSRLRVSEAVLDDSETAALYVYKGVMSARAVERKLGEIAKGRG